MQREPMTPAGHARLKEELARLKAEMPKISEEIGTAADHGDLKENAEYHAAREKQGMVVARMTDIEDQLARAEVIDPAQLGGDRVKFGAIVELEDVDSGKTVTYSIVGRAETDVGAGKISVTSPVAKALIGKEPGDEVRVKTPGGLRTYEVVDVGWLEG